MNLTQKTILITGGNSGIGFNLVKQLSTKNNQLIVVTRSENNWDQITEINPDITKIQCDLSKKNEVLHLAEKLKSKNIDLDVLINCAAVQYTPKLIDDDFAFDQIDVEITTNFTSVMWLSYLLLPTLLSRSQSAIVNLSSGLALYPKSSSAGYCASKAAIHSFSQSLRYQLSNTPVKVIEVLLPLVDTPMTTGRGKGKISPEAAALEIIKGIEREKNEIYVGKARLLPLLIRLYPGLVKRILKKH